MAYNPTVAKELALDFLEQIGQRPNPAVMARTIKSIRELMESGYNDEEIKYAMDYTLTIKPDIYSFAYISTTIDKALRIRAKKQPHHAIDVREVVVTKESEVTENVGLAERNKRKADRASVQSRKRAEHYLDMLKGQ